MEPDRELDCRIEISRQIPAVDWLVVGSPVPEEHQVGEVAFDFSAALAEVGVPAREGCVERGHPQAGVVALCGQVTPGAEAELGATRGPVLAACRIHVQRLEPSTAHHPG